MKDPIPFPIRIIKRVVFRDCEGTITRVYKVGDIIRATAKGNGYFVHSYGGIYFSEAVEAYTQAA